MDTRSPKMLDADLIARELQLAHLLVSRMERLSADSSWAHFSSGYRGALLRLMDRLERGNYSPDSEEDKQQDLERLRQIVGASFALLECAARDLQE